MSRREFTDSDRAFKTDAPRIDKPIEGYYRVKLVRGGPWVSARIWYGAPNDPETGEPLDRSPRWQALRNGRECDVNDLWPWCVREPIDKAEYDFLLADHYWAAEYAPEVPEANPTKAVDLSKLPPIF